MFNTGSRATPPPQDRPCKSGGRARSGSQTKHVPKRATMSFKSDKDTPPKLSSKQGAGTWLLRAKDWLRTTSCPPQCSGLILRRAIDDCVNGVEGELSRFVYSLDEEDLMAGVGSEEWSAVDLHTKMTRFHQAHLGAMFLIEQIKKRYTKTDVVSIFAAYQDYISYGRSSNQPINSYVAERSTRRRMFHKQLQQANIKKENWGETLTALETIKGASLSRSQQDIILGRIGNDIEDLDTEQAEELLCCLQSHEDFFTKPKTCSDPGPVPMDIGAVQQKDDRRTGGPRDNYNNNHRNHEKPTLEDVKTRMRERQCVACGQRGHRAHQCKSADKKSIIAALDHVRDVLAKRQRHNQAQRVAAVELAEEDDDEGYQSEEPETDDLYACDDDDSAADDPGTAVVEWAANVDGGGAFGDVSRVGDMILDTGAKRNICDERDLIRFRQVAEARGLPCHVSPSKLRFRGFEGTTVPSRGTTSIQTACGTTVNIEAVQAREGSRAGSLMGLASIQQLGIEPDFAGGRFRAPRMGIHQWRELRTSGGYHILNLFDDLEPDNAEHPGNPPKEIFALTESEARTALGRHAEQLIDGEPSTGILKKLHRNLGHDSKRVVTILSRLKAKPETIRAYKEIAEGCEICAANGRAPRNSCTSGEFVQRVAEICEADVMHIVSPTDQRVSAFIFVDVLTRYITAVVPQCDGQAYNATHALKAFDVASANLGRYPLILRTDRDNIFKAARSQMLERGTELILRTPHAFVVEAAIHRLREQFARAATERPTICPLTLLFEAVDRANARPDAITLVPPKQLIRNPADSKQLRAQADALAARQVARALSNRGGAAWDKLEVGARVLIWTDNKARSMRGWKRRGVVVKRLGDRVYEVKDDETKRIRTMHRTNVRPYSVLGEVHSDEDEDPAEEPDVEAQGAPNGPEDPPRDSPHTHDEVISFQHSSWDSVMLGYEAPSYLDPRRVVAATFRRPGNAAANPPMTPEVLSQLIRVCVVYKDGKVIETAISADHEPTVFPEAQEVQTYWVTTCPACRGKKRRHDMCRRSSPPFDLASAGPTRRIEVLPLDDAEPAPAIPLPDAVREHSPPPTPDQRTEEPGDSAGLGEQQEPPQNAKRSRDEDATDDEHETTRRRREPTEQSNIIDNEAMEIMATVEAGSTPAEPVYSASSPDVTWGDVGTCTMQRDQDSQATTIPVRRRFAIENWQHFAPALEKEWAKMVEAEVFGPVGPLPAGASALDSLVVYTLKKDEDTGDQELRKARARWAARGDQERGVKNADSPVATRCAFRTLLAVCAQRGWKVASWDVKGAYLHADINRELYIRVPPELVRLGIFDDEIKSNGWDPDRLYLPLRKALYGLADAGRLWFEHLSAILREEGFRRTPCDPAVFVYPGKDGRPDGVIALNVDDTLHGGGEEFAKAMERVDGRLRVGSKRSGTFGFCGLTIEQTDHEILLHQSSYVEAIPENFIKTRGRLDNEPLSDDEVHALRAALGKVAWLASNTSPQAAYQASNVAQRLGEHATVGTARAFCSVVRWLKANHKPLRYVSLPGGTGDVHVEVFGDSSFAKQPRGHSQIGVISFLVSHPTQSDQGTRFCPLHWTSRATPRVCRTNTGAELIAMGDAADEALYRTTLVRAMLGECGTPKAYGDCKNVLDAVSNTTSRPKEKNLNTDLWFIRDIVARGELQTAWVCTEEQLADALTKGRWDILKRLDTALRLGSFWTYQDPHNTHRGWARMHREHRDATP